MLPCRPKQGAWALALLAVCALGSSGVAALYDKGGAVLQLTPRSWEKVEKSVVPVVVEFYAPWCGHCKSLAPAFKAAAEKLQGIVPFVAVDCDREANKPLCGRYEVKGFPTIKLFTPGSATPTDYQGPREAKPLSNAAVGLLTSKHVQRVSKMSDLAGLMAATDKTKVVLVTQKPSTPPMFKSLAQRFSNKGMLFAEVVLTDANRALLATHGVDKAPLLVALPAGEGAEGKVVYDGELKAPKIMHWLSELAKDSSAGSPSQNAPKQQQQGKEGEAGKGQAKQEEKAAPAEIPQVVTNVTAAELAGRLEKEGVVVASLYAGSEAACREQLGKLNAAVHGLHGLATAIQVDLSQPKEAAAVQGVYSVSLPQAVEGGCQMRTFLLPFDPEDHEDADEWRVHEGEVSTKALYKAALELFPASRITPLDEESLRQWTGAEPMRVKVMLFTDKDEPPALYRALSANFRLYKMDFGLVGSKEEAVMKQFNVIQVPSLVAIMAQPDPTAKPDAQGRAGIRFGIQPYMGPLRYSNLATWLTILGLQSGTAPEDAMGMFGGAKQDATLAQVTDQESWQDSCLGKGGVCIVAALSADEKEQAAQLEVLRGAAAGRAEQPLHFAWFQASPLGGAAGFAGQLGLDAGQAPALVAVSPRKERTAVMTARFDKDSISEWLDGLLAGKVHTSPLQRLPDFPAAGGSSEAEAGGGEAAVEEDEFDLSDIMNEEIEGDLSKAAGKDEL